MKITTWNVNGLRAVLNKGAWPGVDALSSDVLCLQEIKTRPDQLTDGQHEIINNLNWIWNPAERPGYSGVATGMKKHQPDLQFIKGLGVEKFDREGRMIQTDHENFLLFNIYFPNGSRDHSRVPFKLEFYEKLLDYCDALHKQGKRIVLCGDFNTSHQEIDLANPKSNQKTTGFLPEERAWVDKYLASGFVDIWRERYPDRTQYTWWTYITNARARNVGWRLDYFLISDTLMPDVEDVIIHDDVIGSDHCPVSLVFK